MRPNEALLLLRVSHRSCGASSSTFTSVITKNLQDGIFRSRTKHKNQRQIDPDILASSRNSKRLSFWRKDTHACTPEVFGRDLHLNLLRRSRDGSSLVILVAHRLEFPGHELIENQSPVKSYLGKSLSGKTITDRPTGL